MKRFAGRTVVVTGASRGIGAAAARRFAAEGARVVVCARTFEVRDDIPGSVMATVRSLAPHADGHLGIGVDLSDGDDRLRLIDEVLAAVGTVDVLINNAAAAMYQPMLDLSLKRRRLVTEVNLHAPIDLAQGFAPGMVERGEGWIVNLSSGSARPRPGPPFHEGATGSTIGFYGASKAALNRFSNALAMELHPNGVRVNTVEPRAAVMSEGAERLVGGHLREDQIESMEAMVEAITWLACCPADRTGRAEVSLDLLDELDLTVMELGAGAPYPGRQRRTDRTD